MDEREIRYGDVFLAAEEFLGRFPDTFTRANCEDIAQEAAIETWRRCATLRDPSRAAAFARTIARRLRFHGIRRARRRDQASSIDHEASIAGHASVERGAAQSARGYRIDGEWVDATWCEGQIDDVLRGLGPLNGSIVRAFYAGSSCAELGERFGLPSAGVKARLHRSRLRIRDTIVERVRNASDAGDGARAPAPRIPKTEGEMT